TDAELNEAMRQEALRFGAQAQQVFDMLRQNQNAQAQLRAPIYEEKVVDLILSRAEVAEKPVSKDELMADDELPEGYVEADAKPAKTKGGKPRSAKAAKAEPAAEAEAPTPAEAASEPAAEAKPKPAKKTAKAAAAPETEGAKPAKGAKAPAKPKAGAKSKSA